MKSLEMYPTARYMTDINHLRHQVAPWWKPWPVRFTLFLIVCQIGLLFLGNTPLRVPLRVAAYGGSLFLLTQLTSLKFVHPAYRIARFIPAWLTLMLVLPNRSSFVAAFAQIGLYLSILGPIVWVGGIRPSFKNFRTVILLLWGFNAASAAVGVLQVYYPGSFQGAMSNVIIEQKDYKARYAVYLADGTQTLRPMGLTDSPGGAAFDGVNAILLGIGVLLSDRRKVFQFLAIAGCALGLFAIYLSHVRISLIVVGIGTIVILFMMGMRGQLRLAIQSAIGVSLLAVLSTMWAMSVGGENTFTRFQSLMEQDAGTVYYQNRGHFFEHFLNYAIWEYPVGAGLGRWGMMNYYFGGGRNSLWSEMMWTSWLYDGGIPFIFLNLAALAIALNVAWRLATGRQKLKPSQPSRDLQNWAGVVFAYTFASCVCTLNSPVFAIQYGMEVWLMNALLWSAANDPQLTGQSKKSKVAMTRTLHNGLSR